MTRKQMIRKRRIVMWFRKLEQAMIALELRVFGERTGHSDTSAGPHGGWHCSGQDYARRGDRVAVIYEVWIFVIIITMMSYMGIGMTCETLGPVLAVGLLLILIKPQLNLKKEPNEWERTIDYPKNCVFKTQSLCMEWFQYILKKKKLRTVDKILLNVISLVCKEKNF